MDLWDDDMEDEEIKTSEKPLKFAFNRAIELPDPGASYRPNSKDHMTLLNKAIEEETKKKNSESKKTILINDAKRHENAGISLEGLFSDGKAISMTISSKRDENNPVVEEEEDETTEFIRNPPIKPKNKFKKKRDRLGLEKARKKAILEKEKLLPKKKIMSIEEINEEIKKTLALKSLSSAKKALKKTLKLKLRENRRRISSIPIAVQSKSNLTNSLRRLKPEGNLLYDKLKNWQARSIITGGISKTRTTSTLPRAHNSRLRTPEPMM